MCVIGDHACRKFIGIITQNSRGQSYGIGWDVVIFLSIRRVAGDDVVVDYSCWFELLFRRKEERRKMMSAFDDRTKEREFVCFLQGMR